jgi:hypothetical protein
MRSWGTVRKTSFPLRHGKDSDQNRKLPATLMGRWDCLRPRGARKGQEQSVLVEKLSTGMGAGNPKAGLTPDCWGK